MGRPKRADVAGGIYHMLNRANLRATIFHKADDYEAFERIMAEALAKFDLSLLCYCLMPNHWHFVVQPRVDGEMGRFGQWVSLTHTQRYHSHYHTVGMGHLYQGRYKSFPVQSDEHFLTLCRYVERNALAAGCASNRTSGGMGVSIAGVAARRARKRCSHRGPSPGAPTGSSGCAQNFQRPSGIRFSGV